MIAAFVERIVLFLSEINWGGCTGYPARGRRK